MIPDNDDPEISQSLNYHRELPGGARQRIVAKNSPLSRLSETGFVKSPSVVQLGALPLQREDIRTVSNAPTKPK